MIELNVNTPSLASKRIKITRYDNKRKIQISSNLLPLFGFEKGTAVVERELGEGEGYIVELANPGMPYNNIKKIYQRTYKQRKCNPLETLFETSAKRILDKSIPMITEVVHVTMVYGKIIVKPIIDIVKEQLSKLAKAINPYTVFCACTSGVDAHAAYSAGFDINAAIEFRPVESRDKTDKTETGIMSLIANVPVKKVFNEDITFVSTEYLRWATKKTPSSVFTISLQCDSLSNAKSNSLKEASFDNKDCSLDMLIDGLRIIDAFRFPVVVLEQVTGFAKSDVGKVWDLRLRKLGYRTQSVITDPRDHSGLTSRKRFIHVATLLPNKFVFPEKIERTNESIWDQYIKPHLDKMRDITHTSSIKKGLANGRLRVINKESTYANTIMKSQNRQAADSLVVEHDNKILFPNEELLRDLMGIPKSFNLDVNNKEIATEIIGQAVDYPYYHSLMQKVKEHINEFITQSNFNLAL